MSALNRRLRLILYRFQTMYTHAITVPHHQYLLTRFLGAFPTLLLAPAAYTTTMNDVEKLIVREVLSLECV